MSKRILVATGLYPPDIGGPATYTKMLEDELPQRGYELDVYAFGEVRHLPKIVRHMVYAVRLIKRARDADVIYALDPVSVGLPALVAKWLTGKPLLLRLGGDYAWEQGQQRFGVTDLLDEFITKRSSYRLPVRMLCWLQSYVARRAKSVNVQSEYMKGIISSWGVDPERIEVIPSALHPVVLSDKRESLRSAFEYDGIVLSTACRLVPWKGIDLLIGLLPDLQKRFGQVSLVVIGDGSERANLERLANDVGVSDSVRFTGRQPKNAMGAAIYASDLFVYNTAYEGLSHQLLEVMDLGVPIVTTMVGGNLELIKDGVSGLLVIHNDRPAFLAAIVRLLENESLRAQLTQHARAHTKGYSEAATVEKISALFERTLK